ncbi:pilus assembly protein TadG-related protein [Pseudomonas tolaasii]|uniref:pilus assembly protein TadG-related protein n=1 Tax=Pseudomonas tolaasii TaxID=29442 RepID=UPI0030CF9918
MFGHGPGPARQRGAIGLIGAFTLAIALLFLLLVVDSGRLYLEKRKLQRVADTAALEAVSRGGKCVAPNNNAAQIVIESAQRNDFTVSADRTLATACGTLATGADFMRTFNPDPARADAIRVIATHRVPTSLAHGLFTLFSTKPVSLTTLLSATAVAAAPSPPVASLTIRSTLLTVDSTKSAALNGLIGGLLGGKLQLDAVGWNGLINTNISLLSYLDALAIRLNVSAGNYDQLLKTDATVGQLIQAAIDVLKLGGDAVKVVINNLEAIKLIAPGTEILHLGDLIKIQNGTDKTALNVDLQLFNLIQGFVQLSNKASAVAVELPVDVLGLLNITVKTRVIEPAQISAVGNPQLIATQPITVRTAQVRTWISIKLPVIDVLNKVVELVTNLVSLLLGSSLDPVIGTHIDIALEAASGSSTVTGYRCNGPEDKSLDCVGHHVGGQVDGGSDRSQKPVFVSRPLEGRRFPPARSWRKSLRQGRMRPPASLCRGRPQPAGGQQRGQDHTRPRLRVATRHQAAAELLQFQCQQRGRQFERHPQGHSIDQPYTDPGWLAGPGTGFGGRHTDRRAEPAQRHHFQPAQPFARPAGQQPPRRPGH